jgi:KamA family protein
MKHNVNDIRSVRQVSGLKGQALVQADRVEQTFPFLSNSYYLALIDWTDPDDPIRKIIIPDIRELDQWGDLDPSDEHSYSVMPGLEHKYSSTALVLLSNECAGICRYCFRKRVFLDPHKEQVTDVDPMIRYIANHPEITNVLLSGGDPLTLSTERLDNILTRLRQIDHVHIIRIGTKLPVFNPYRIIDDPELIAMIRRHSLPRKKIYIMTHFMHPRELTDAAVEAANLMQTAGAIVNNQCPLIRGVNDDEYILAELWRELAFAGIIPYYVFQCRPVVGNSVYAVPIEEGYTLVENAKNMVSGLSKRIRFAMSHASGKIEIAAMTDDRIFMRHHRSATFENSGRILELERNGDAYWLDDYDEPVAIYEPDGTSLWQHRWKG